AWLAAYVIGSLAIVAAYARRPLPRSVGAFRVTVALALAPLVIVKASPLVAAVAHHATAVAASASPLALGLFDRLCFLVLSYMTLRLIDVLVLLRDGVVKEPPRSADLASYLLFFPTISAGPIDRFRHFTASLDALPRSRGEYLRDVEAGIHRIAQ